MNPPALKVALACHPATPCTTLAAVEASLTQAPCGALDVHYRLSGDVRRLLVPASQPPAPTDGLWQHTCCELFVAVAGEPAYREFNFSPSGQWAAYAFDAYRQRAAHPLSIPAPRSRLQVTEEGVELFVELAPDALPRTAPGTVLQVGLSTVVEARDGTFSYWALRHPSPRPDFHHRDAFDLTLPASRQAAQRTS